MEDFGVFSLKLGYLFIMRSAYFLIIITHLSFKWDVMLEGIIAFLILTVITFIGRFIPWDDFASSGDSE